MPAALPFEGVARQVVLGLKYRNRRAVARQLAAGAPAALAATKRLLLNGLTLSPEAAMPEENRTQAQLCGMQDALEGLSAVIEKRAPRFTGR